MKEISFKSEFINFPNENIENLYYVKTDQKRL